MVQTLGQTILRHLCFTGNARTRHLDWVGGKGILDFFIVAIAALCHTVLRTMIYSTTFKKETQSATFSLTSNSGLRLKQPVGGASGSRNGFLWWCHLDKPPQICKALFNCSKQCRRSAILQNFLSNLKSEYMEGKKCLILGCFEYVVKQACCSRRPVLLTEIWK